MRTLPRLQGSLLALAIVLIPAYFAVVHGNTIDLGAFVYAVPIAGIAFVVLAVAFRAAALRGGYRPSLVTANPVRRAVRHPSVQLAFSVIGLAIVGGFYLAADRDARAYARDPSCAVILVYDRADPGACRAQPAQIVDTGITSSRSGTHKHLRIQFSDGSSRWVELAGGYPRGLWHDARTGTVHGVVVQWYRGRIVALTTTSGRAMTSAMPSTRTTGLFIMSLALAVSGIFSAARILLGKPAT